MERGMKMDSEIFAFYAIIRGIMVLMAVLVLALYLFDAVSRYKYFKVRGYEKSILAFIPFANIWASVEATYGKTDKVNIYGWKAPALIVKLWGVVFYALTVAVSGIPVVGRLIGLALLVANVAVMAQLYADMMERLDEPQERLVSVVAVIINFAASYKLIRAAGRFQVGQQSYRDDDRILRSQSTADGPLSFVNDKI